MSGTCGCGQEERETDACTAYMRHESNTMPHVQYVCCVCAVGMSAMHSGRCGIGKSGSGCWAG